MRTTRTIAYSLLLALAMRPEAQTGIPKESEFSSKAVALGLDSPWALAFPDDTTALVTLKGGELLSIDLRSGTRRTVAGLPKIRSIGQGGLLDIALAPDFRTSGTLFFSFSESHADGYGTAIARARLNADGSSLEGWTVIFSGNNRSYGGMHFGSRIAFDADGYLVATIGERNERDKARDVRFHNGKTIRIDRDGASAPGNPVLGPGAAPGIFTYGHRNQQGLALRPGTGELWLHEHGPRGGDEVNVLRPGVDYGWPLVTYGREYSGATVGGGASKAPGVVDPLLHWSPSIAPSGMAFYRGDAFPAWRGDLLVGALAGMELRRIRIDGSRIAGQTSYLKGWNRIRDVRVGPGGLVYLLTDGEDGALWRLDPE